MQIIRGNIWDYHKSDNSFTPDNPYFHGCAIAVTTNGMIRKDGKAVMGAGIALQAAQRFPHLPEALADGLIKHGNIVLYYINYNLFTFPTKHDWKQPSDLSLIEKSAIHLAYALTKDEYKYLRVVMTKPGCGHGRLSWKQVEPVLDKHLSCFADRIRIIDL